MKPVQQLAVFLSQSPSVWITILPITFPKLFPLLNCLSNWRQTIKYFVFPYHKTCSNVAILRRLQKKSFLITSVTRSANSRRGLTKESFTRAETFEYISLHSFQAHYHWTNANFCKITNKLHIDRYSPGTLGPDGGIWKHSFIATVSPTVHSNPSRKRSFSKTVFELE